MLVFQAVKKIEAQHRLILSGTPIQNNIQELWALFDFLMPDFLGNEAAFNQQFGKAFKAGRSSKAGSNEAQSSILAMDVLHKKVRPRLAYACAEYRWVQSSSVGSFPYTFIHLVKLPMGHTPQQVENYLAHWNARRYTIVPAFGQ